MEEFVEAEALGNANHLQKLLNTSTESGHPTKQIFILANYKASTL